MPRYFTRARPPIARITSSGSVPPMPAPPIVPCYHQQDNQAQLVPQVIAARLRREAYANCDRAPFGWEARA